MLARVADAFREVAPARAWWSLRAVAEHHESLAVRRGVVQPPSVHHDLGAMVSVIDGGGAGYAATSDLSREGLRDAGRRAQEWARLCAGRSVHALPPAAGAGGEYASTCTTPWESVSRAAKLDRLRVAADALACDPRIVDWGASLVGSKVDTHLATADGTRVDQSLRLLWPSLRATAHEAGDSETRTFGGDAYARQGGLEILEALGFDAAPQRIAEQALALLTAPDCPSGPCDLVLAPDQMILQIHESIGHPLELDRILGDERNYAGSSFVTPEMFGSYRYGSALLDVTFDPTVATELGSYGFDDEGARAEREHLIRRGVLVRGLGGALSQARSGLPGVAASRASGWNRPPIDRMANLNLEPGDDSLEALVSGVERGVYMETNCSWSIDDARNKFQFGCEWGRRIEDGELRGVVRRPNYRGRSATFWRSLTGVGDATTREVLGTPTCGKGEPNQLARVGHASPACRFAGVDVFGGAAAA